MLARLARALLIIAIGLTALTACIPTNQVNAPSTTDNEQRMRSGAHQQAVSGWQRAWIDPPSDAVASGVQPASAQFKGNWADVEYRTPSGSRQIEIRNIDSAPNACSRWNLSAAETAAGIEWRGFCRIQYAARSRDGGLTGQYQDWSQWNNCGDDVICELVNGVWTTAIGNGDMVPLIRGEKQVRSNDTIRR